MQKSTARFSSSRRDLRRITNSRNAPSDVFPIFRSFLSDDAKERTAHIFSESQNKDSGNIHDALFSLHSSTTGNVRGYVESAAIDGTTFSNSHPMIEAALQSSYDAQFHWQWDYTVEERCQVMLNLVDILRSSSSNSNSRSIQDSISEQIAQLETEDTGRAYVETQWEANGAIECYEWTISNVLDSMTYEKSSTKPIALPFQHGIGFGGRTHPSFKMNDSKTSSIDANSNDWGYTRREPYGVTVGIGAWNYPFQSVVWKSAPALTTGNSMIFKPSEYTPQTALLLADLYRQAGLPDGVFQVLLGPGSTVGQKLLEDGRVQKVSFTGSVTTGRNIYQQAAKDLKAVTLELGGKSPLIIWDDVCDSSLDEAVTAIMMANWYSTGQVCSNGTRVFVHSSSVDRVVERLIERTKKLKIGDPMNRESHIGPLIHKEQLNRVQEYVRIGVEEDRATLVYGGERLYQKMDGISDDDKNGTHNFSNGSFICPAIFTNCTDDMRICCEEVFGPVLSILTFDTEEEVLERANHATTMGLAAGVFTKDMDRAHRMVGKIQSGITYINQYNIAPMELPWSGWKNSGLGSENGVEGIESWTKVKSVYVGMDRIESPYDE